MLTLFGYVFKNLGRQKLRTALAALGVMLGVWMVVVFAAISAGALKTVEAMLTEFGEDFHCYKAGVADQFLSALPESETRKNIRSVPGVKDTASVTTWLSRTPEVPWLFLFGLRPDEFAAQQILSRGGGSFSAVDAREVVLGKRLAERLKLGKGDTLNLQGNELRVVGIFVTGKPLYDNAAVVPLKTVQEDFRGGSDTATLIAVRVVDGASPKEVADEVERRFPEVSAVRTMEELSKVDQGLEKMKLWSVVITVVATCLGLLFVLLAMVMSVFERTREVGILRAVGWRKRKIVLTVLIEAVFLAVIGVLAGIPTGVAGVELIAALSDLSSFVKPSYEPALYLRALLVALGAAAIGGIYPAWRASKLHPVEAIRHE